MNNANLIHTGRALTTASGVTVGLAIGAPAAIAIGATLTTFRWAINSVNTALIFMILVVAIAAIGGRLAGVITALVAVMSFDFFHTEPYLSMAIESRDDIETTALLLMSGLLVGTMATTGRAARQREHAARAEVRRIHRVAEAAATGLPPAEVLTAATDEITDVLDLTECWFEATPYTDHARRPRLGRNGAIEDQSVFRFRRDSGGRPGFELPADGIELPVLARGHHIGRFVLVPSAKTGTSVQNRLVTVAIADQFGAAVDRTLERPEVGRSGATSLASYPYCLQRPPVSRPASGPC